MPVRWERDHTPDKLWKSRQGTGKAFHQLDDVAPEYSRLRDGVRSRADLQDTTAEDLWSGSDPRHLRASPAQNTPPRAWSRRKSPANAQPASLLRRSFQPANRGSPGVLQAQATQLRGIPSPPVPSMSQGSTAQATSIASSPAPELVFRLTEHTQAVSSQPTEAIAFKGFHHPAQLEADAALPEAAVRYRGSSESGVSTALTSPPSLSGEEAGHAKYPCSA